MATVGIQGGKGSFHEMAALKYFSGGGTEIVAVDTFSDLFRKYRDGAVDYAVVAIANNRYGFIAEAYSELMNRHRDYTIGGEVYIKVEHQLLGLPGAKLSEVKEVHSQAPALGQCHDFLEKQLPHAVLVEETDTAESARLIARLKNPHKAAIASRRAGEIHGLQVLKADIQDDHDNITRFLVLSRDPGDPGPGANKTTLLLRTAQKAGSLADVLTIFKACGINISTLHSSFLPNTSFEMQFLIELECAADDTAFKTAARQIKALGREYSIEIMGSYKRAELPAGRL